GEMRRSRTALMLAALWCAAWPSGAAAQNEEQAAHGHHHGDAMPTGDQLGQLAFPNSGRPAAQAPFLRGVKLLHNFQFEEAIEAVQPAPKADPASALSY